MNIPLRWLRDLRAAKTEPPSHLGAPRAMLLTIVVLIASFLAWAAWFELDELVRGEARLLPPQRLQTVQHLEGGLLVELRVAEGDAVRKGQVLMLLDTKGSLSELAEVKRPWLQAMAELARIDAELNGGPLRLTPQLNEHPELRRQTEHKLAANRAEQQHVQSGLNQAIEQRQQAWQRLRADLSLGTRELQLLRQEMDLLRPLAPNVLAPAELLRRERELIAKEASQSALSHQVMEAASALRQALAERDKTQATHRAALLKERAEHQSHLDVLSARTSEKTDRLARASVLAPADGVVRQVYARTPGQVVSPGAPLLDLVPESDQLIVEAQVAPGDVGFLHPGQKARIKVSAYDFAVYGALDGEIQRISADTVIDKDSRDPRPHYLVTIAAANALRDRHGQPLALAPGMTASVDIVTGRRTVLTYLFKPLVRGMSQALRER